jgi:hypothetical protein
MHWVSDHWVFELHPVDISKRYEFRASIYPSIFVSWVFGKAATFKNETWIAIWRSDENFGSDLNSYFPTSIIGMPNKPMKMSSVLIK